MLSGSCSRTYLVPKLLQRSAHCCYSQLVYMLYAAHHKNCCRCGCRAELLCRVSRTSEATTLMTSSGSGGTVRPLPVSSQLGPNSRAEVAVWGCLARGDAQSKYNEHPLTCSCSRSVTAGRGGGRYLQRHQSHCFRTALPTACSSLRT